MNKITFIIILTIASTILFAEFKITKNKLIPGMGFGYELNSRRDTFGATTVFDIPNISFEFEGTPNEMFKVFIHSDLVYNMSKYTYDGEAPTGMNSYASDFFFELNPMLKAYFKKNTFVKIALPYSNSILTSQSENSDSYGVQNLNVIAEFGFDNRIIEQHFISQWNKFETGMAFYGYFDSEIINSVDGESAEDTSNILGFTGCYSYTKKNIYLMIKPYIDFKTQLNSKLEDYWWFTIGTFGAWDYKQDFNLEVHTGIKYGEGGITPDISTLDNFGVETFFVMSAQANYYLKRNLSIFAGLEIEKLLLADQKLDDGSQHPQFDSPEILFKFGATYTLNFLTDK